MVQLDETSNEAGLYRYVIRSFIRFEQAVSAEAHERIAKAREHLRDVVPSGEGNDPLHRDQNGPLVEEVADVMVSVWGKDNSFVFEPLEEAVDR